MNEFTPPTDPVVHAIWVIRNWTRLPIGNVETYENIVRRVNKLSNEVFDRFFEAPGVDFKPPSDDALRTIWHIRNATRLPKGNVQSYDDLVRSANDIASQAFERLNPHLENNQPA